MCKKILHIFSLSTGFFHIIDTIPGAAIYVTKAQSVENTNDKMKCKPIECTSSYPDH